MRYTYASFTLFEEKGTGRARLAPTRSSFCLWLPSDLAATLFCAPLCWDFFEEDLHASWDTPSLDRFRCCNSLHFLNGIFRHRPDARKRFSRGNEMAAHWPVPRRARGGGGRR